MIVKKARIIWPQNEASESYQADEGQSSFH